ncbi:MAG: hypothetical protein NTX24_04300 [Candidatus Pacearchaeota archaeon]|nr:hypothetical protein [Candidatus Pacearchaeota archaeon]
MTVQELSTKLFYIRGENELKLAQIDNKPSVVIERGRCLYMVRLEVALAGHPEIIDKRFELKVKRATEEIYLSKGLGGGQRGLVGEEIPFERFIANATFPNDRTDEKPEFTDPLIEEATKAILRGLNYNCNFKIYSQYGGIHGGIHSRHMVQFNETKTYLPVIVQALEEVQPLL